MTHKSKTGAEHTWWDVVDAVSDWSDHMGVEVVVKLQFDTSYPHGAFALIEVHDASPEAPKGAIKTNRVPFPARKGKGHAGAVLHGIFETLNMVEASPWEWSVKMRKAAADADL